MAEQVRSAKPIKSLLKSNPKQQQELRYYKASFFFIIFFFQRYFITIGFLPGLRSRNISIALFFFPINILLE